MMVSQLVLFVVLAWYNLPVLDYIYLAEHFQKAALSVFNNNWSNVHDFTPIEGENNWCLFPDTIRIQDYVSLPASPELQRYVCKSLNLQHSALWSSDKGD